MSNLDPNIHLNPNVKPAGTTDPGLKQAMEEYLGQFVYKVRLHLGPSYSTPFKQFNTWCEQRLGSKYKDWFLYAMDRDEYILFLRDPKWITFLTLTWVDLIV